MLYSFKSSYEITFELQRYEITDKTETIRVKQNSLWSLVKNQKDKKKEIVKI